jgi:RHS repeat-associated protein
MTDLGYVGGQLLPNNMYHFGARFYDPSLARWTQEDPLAAVASRQDANRYAYAGGNPVMNADPSGLFSLGLDVDLELGSVHANVGASIDGHGSVEVHGGGGGGTGEGLSGGLSGSVNPSGKASSGGEIEGGGCVGAEASACYHASSSGGAGAGIGMGSGAGITYVRKKKLW